MELLSSRRSGRRFRLLYERVECSGILYCVKSFMGAWELALELGCQVFLLRPVCSLWVCLRGHGLMGRLDGSGVLG